MKDLAVTATFIVFAVVLTAYGRDVIGAAFFVSAVVVGVAGNIIAAIDRVGDRR